MPDTVQYLFWSDVAHLTLADPRSGNALGPELVTGLKTMLERALTERSCRAIVIDAEGDSFCSGMDLDAARAGPLQVEPFLRLFLDCLSAIRGTHVPVIAHVAGRAQGGGVGLVAACDLVIAGEGATFALPEALVGMFPALIGPFLLRRLSPARACSLALSTRALTAAEALALGLVDEVATDSRAALIRQLQRLLRASPEALAACKRYFTLLSGDGKVQQDAGLAHLLEWVARPEVADGLRLFGEGLTPPWFGRYRPPANPEEASNV